MKTNMKLGNTGFSILINTEDEAVSPTQGSVKDIVELDNELIKYSSFKSKEGQGPAFTWEWVERGELGHTVAQARSIDTLLFNALNVGEYKRDKDAHGDLLLASGISLEYLTGFVTSDIEDVSVEFYNDGINAYTSRKNAIPVFTIEDAETLMLHGANILRDNCVIKHNDFSYLVTTGEMGVPDIEVPTGSDVIFTVALHEIVCVRGIWGNLREMTTKEVASFLGPKGETISVRECTDSQWINESINSRGYDVRIVGYEGRLYTYLSNVELDRSVRAAIK